MNHNVKILSRRWYSPILKDLAWLERAWQGRRGGGGKKLQTNVWKIRKINWASSIQPTSFKLGEYNLLINILTLRFINCVKFNFGKKLFAIGYPYKHCNFWPLCLPAKMALKSVIRPIPRYSVELITIPLGFAIQSFTIIYFKLPPFRTNFRFPWRFEIAAFNCI